MKLKIAVCDDESAVCQANASLVTRWGAENGHLLTLTQYSSAEQFLFENGETVPFDILLLDIEMKKMDGVALAKRIRQSNRSVQILFITGYPEHIAEGYEVAALHYLMKPLKEDKLFEVLDRAAVNLGTARKKLVIRCEGEDVVILADGILYAEAFSHALKIVTSNRVYETRMTIGELSALLGKDFVQPHRSYLVNLDHIEGLGKTELLLQGGIKLPISRNEQKKVHEAFVKYYRGNEL